MCYTIRSMKAIPASLKPYFWDTNVADLDAKTHVNFIAERIMEYGDKTAAAWLLATYSKKVLHGVVIGNRALSPRTRHFWALILDLPEHTKLCMKKSSARTPKTAWSALQTHR